MLENIQDAGGLVTPATEAQPTEPTPTEAEEQPIELDAAPGAEEEAQAKGAETEEGAEGGEEQPEAQEPEQAMEEVEVNGKKYTIPADLKANLMMQADYTRKTQEVAELRKAAEVEQEKAASLFQSSQDFIQANAALMNIDSQLQQYQNVNWQQLEQEDPIGAMSHWRQFQQLQGQRQQVAGYLQNAEHQRNANAEQEIANRLRQTAEFAQKEIPGWNNQLDAEITKFAEDSGFTQEQLKAAMNPQIYKILHRAMLGEKVLQQQKAQPRPQSPAPKPMSKVTAKGGPAVSKNPEDMSMEEYTAYRKQEGAKLR